MNKAIFLYIIFTELIFIISVLRCPVTYFMCNYQKGEATLTKGLRCPVVIPNNL